MFSFGHASNPHATAGDRASHGALPAPSVLPWRATQRQPLAGAETYSASSPSTRSSPSAASSPPATGAVRRGDGSQQGRRQVPVPGAAPVNPFAHPSSLVPSSGVSPPLLWYPTSLLLPPPAREPGNCWLRSQPSLTPPGTGVPPNPDEAHVTPSRGRPAPRDNVTLLLPVLRDHPSTPPPPPQLLRVKSSFWEVAAVTAMRLKWLFFYIKVPFQRNLELLKKGRL